MGLLLWAEIDYPRRAALGARRLAEEVGPVTFELVRPQVDRLTEIVPRCDGLIGFARTSALRAALCASGLPVIDLSGGPADGSLPRVVVDHRAIGRRAAEHLIDRGLPRLVYVSEGGTWYARERGEGFRLAAEAAGIPVSLCIAGTPAQLRRVLAATPLPCGVFAEHDMRARRVLDACLALGLQVPDGVSIVGVDNNPLVCEMAPVPLTSVDPASEAVGLAAARALWRWLADGDRPPPLIHVPPGPVAERSSSDHQHQQDPIVAGALACIRRCDVGALSVDTLALQVGVARRTLEKHLRAVRGRSPHEEIQRHRFAVARALLTQTRRPLYAIAQSCGYTDRRHFARAFRQLHGCSPSAYRRAAAGDH
ncbi:MAG: substrate-binding domain-containing protein [Planctomycetota bacterium]